MDVVSENVSKIAALFPNCVTEHKDADGNVVQGIDFEKLQQELSADVIKHGEERYQFTWPGKMEAIREANAPTNCALRPCPDENESVDFWNTKNLYIEGDNLEVLKLLQEDYLGKVKVIYIDPPYNTGKEFIYSDDYSISSLDFSTKAGMFDENGNQLLQNYEKNAETKGRYHTDWLNMIYPRLKVARNLLTEDGVIFISIDDNEVSNLKKIADEIFGPRNFIDIFNWAKTETPENLSVKSRQIIEYVLCYQKKKDNVKFKGIQKFSKSSNGLLNQPNAVGTLTFPANKVVTSMKDCHLTAGMYGTDKYEVELLNDVDIRKGLFVNEFSLRAKFKWSQSYLKNEIENGTIISIPTNKLSPAYEKNEYSPEVPTNLINSKVGVETNENAGEYQLQLFDRKMFSFPKPCSLVKYLVNFNKPNEPFIVMDFFSGSGTTGEAIMQMNAENGNNNAQFILVQLQEDLNKSLKETKEASQKEIIQNAIDFLSENGKDCNLCEIAKERLRRSGSKVKENAGTFADKIDIGFRVLKLAESNMKEVFYTPTETKAAVEQNMFDTKDNIKPDRKGLDLLFQVMLEMDITLDAKIEKKTMQGKEVFFVDDNYLVATFDENVPEDLIKELAKLEPYNLVIANRSFANDSMADNFEQIFKAYSPNTNTMIL